MLTRVLISYIKVIITIFYFKNKYIYIQKDQKIILITFNQVYARSSMELTLTFVNVRAVAQFMRHISFPFILK